MKPAVKRLPPSFLWCQRFAQKGEDAGMGVDQWRRSERRETPSSQKRKNNNKMAQSRAPPLHRSVCGWAGCSVGWRRGGPSSPGRQVPIICFLQVCWVGCVSINHKIDSLHGDTQFFFKSRFCFKKFLLGWGGFSAISKHFFASCFAGCYYRQKPWRRQQEEVVRWWFCFLIFFFFFFFAPPELSQHHSS